MPITYSCFISYPHGQSPLMRDFIEQLKTELGKRIDLWFNRPPYHDEDRLKPGYRYNEALAAAICESVCMVVVYIPKYERSTYCLREYAAMEELERQRRELLGQRLRGHQGMIIPVILRCAEDAGGQPRLPDWLTRDRHYCNFSKYATSTGADDILNNPEYVRQIEEIARGVAEIYDELAALEADPCVDCPDYAIPAEDRVHDRLKAERWREATQGLPLREAAP